MTDKTIKELIWELIKDRLPQQVKICEVLEVNRDQQTCKLKDVSNELEVFNARLASVIKEKDTHVIAWPKVGSKVTVGILDNNPNNGTILQTSEIDELEVISPKVKVEASDEVTVNCDQVVINGGDNEGLVIGPKLVKEINKLRAFVAAIDNTLNTWTVAPSDGGSALKVTWQAARQAVTKGTFNSELFNDKVKH